MASPVLVAVFAILPQTLLLLYAPLGLVGAKTTLRRVIVPGVILTAVVAVTRSIALLFGWHIVIFLFSYLALARIFRLASLLGGLAAASLSFILVVLGDVLLLAPFLAILGLDYEQAIQSTWLYITIGWLESVFLILAAVLVKWKNLVLIPIAARHVMYRQRRDSF